MRTIITLICTLCLTSFAVAQDATPSIACDAPTFEFGSVSNTETVKHTFTVRNDGKSVLNISGVKPACGCTIADISSKVLQPGESATIAASLSLKGRRGLQTKTITVNSDDPKTPAYKLTLKGTAASEVGLEPTSIYVGQLGFGEQVTKDVVITNNGTNPLEIVSITSQNNLVTYSVVTNVVGKSFTVKVTNSDSIPVGRISDYLTITTNNDKAKTERLTVFGNVVAKLAIAPTAITLDPAAGVGDQSITIKPGSVRNFQVIDVIWAENPSAIRVINNGINGFTITLRGISAKPELDGTTVIIKTTVPGLESIEVPISIKAATPAAP